MVFAIKVELIGGCVCREGDATDAPERARAPPGKTGGLPDAHRSRGTGLGLRVEG